MCTPSSNTQPLVLGPITPSHSTHQNKIACDSLPLPTPSSPHPLHSHSHSHPHPPSAYTSAPSHTHSDWASSRSSSSRPSSPSRARCDRSHAHHAYARARSLYSAAHRLSRQNRNRNRSRTTKRRRRTRRWIRRPLWGGGRCSRLVAGQYLCLGWWGRGDKPLDFLRPSPSLSIVSSLHWTERPSERAAPRRRRMADCGGGGWVEGWVMVWEPVVGAAAVWVCC